MKIVERCYPEIQVHTQVSGRHSTVHPPLAQLPEDLRKLVLPEVGGWEWGYDWDQIELRIVASEAHDRPLIDAFERGYDVHTLSACEIFRLQPPPNPVDPFNLADDATARWADRIDWHGKKDMRRTFAKRFVYRLLYGARPDTCTDIPGVVHLGLDIRGLVQASENWLNAHPAVRAFQRCCAVHAAKRGTIYTFCGRRRTLIETGEEAARQAMNHPMQGGCMDIYEDVLYDIATQHVGSLQFRWGMHDSHKWDVLGGAPTDPTIHAHLVGAAQLATRSRTISGRLTAFPATFYIADDTGREYAWKPMTCLT